jgi:hypothetical protein
MASQSYALRWRCAFLALFGGLAVAAAPMSGLAEGPAEADEFVMSGGFDEDASAYAAHAVHDAPPAGVGSGSILGVDYEESYSGNWDEGYNSGCCDSGCCDSGCCDDVGCASCVGSGRKCPGFWVGGEYLLWRLSGTALPPLVTQSPATTPLNEAGRLNDPNTTIIGGNNVVGGDWRSGYRLFAGVWLDPCQKWALSGDYFSAGSEREHHRNAALFQQPNGRRRRPICLDSESARRHGAGLGWRQFSRRRPDAAALLLFVL